MTWTREHIAAFGGNPEDVTIFGESAGGNSVINHLAQEASFGLYTKAVVESGAYNLGARNMSAAQAGFVGLLGSAQCSDLDCLLAADATAIESAGGHGTAPAVSGGRNGWGPVVDGVSLKAAPIELIHAKQYNNKVRRSMHQDCLLNPRNFVFYPLFTHFPPLFAHFQRLDARNPESTARSPGENGKKSIKIGLKGG